MTRPAIIIGLGGTGQWVLTYVKKDLLELGRGKMPDNVALLAFDTMPQATAEAAMQQGEREVKVGSVKLKTDQEFIHVGGKAFKLAQDISNGKYEHMSWFAADHYLRTLPPSSFNLSMGAGAIRQFGRLAIFHDLAQPANSRINPYIRKAIQSVKDTVTKKTQLEIIIVGSFAGGTGSGMFIDMALLLRSLAAKNFADDHIVRGFFALPRTFSSGSGQRQTAMFARSFAAWRELNRFMIVDPDIGLKEMVYHDKHREFQIDIEKRAYDVCYLMDTQGAQDPEKGLFPSIADAISAILDDTAGQKYTEHVTTNLATIFSDYPGEPMYSTMGTYSVKVPVYYVQQEFAHELSADVLERIIAPIRDERGRIIGLRPNANPENPSYAGKDEVYSFLQQTSITRANETAVYNTMFLPKIAELMENDADQRQDIQQAWAEATLHGRGGPVGWEVPLTNLGDSPEALALLDEINRVVRLQLVMAVPPSRQAGDKPSEAVGRLKRQIPKFKIEQVGVRDTLDDVVSRGKFGDALQKSKEFQVDLFAKMLRLWLLNTLEGRSEDPLIAKAGKLGYAQSFLGELVVVLDRFLDFMHKVKKTREDSHIGNRIAEDARRKYKQYIQRAHKKRLLDIVTKGDYQAQERYLAAEQRVIWVRQDEILHEIVTETAQDILTIAKNARDEIDDWAEMLALNPESYIAGLQMSWDEVRVAHQREAGLEDVQRLVADERYPVSEDVTRDGLGKWHWEVTRQGGRLNVAASWEFAPKKNVRSTRIDENVELLVDYASQKFPLFLEKSVAIELDRDYKHDGDRIAEDLDKKAEPRSEIIGDDGRQRRYAYMRVRSNLNDQVHRTFEDVIAGLKNRNENITYHMVESDDPFKLTIVRSNDMIRPEDFQAWEDCERQYAQLALDKPDQVALLHTFPPEIIAAKYESKLGELELPWRIFHPRVVLLLEDEKRLRMFLKAWAYGLIRESITDNETLPHFELVISEQNERPIHLTSPQKGNDIFLMLNQFVLKGKDVRAGLRRVIRFDRLENAIREEEKRLGRDGAAHLLEEQYEEGIYGQDFTRSSITNSDGFSQRLEQKARELDDKKEGSGRPYHDLAALSALIYRDMVSELRA